VLISELVRRGARRFGEAPAILCGDDTLSFRETDELANRIARVLLGYGVDRAGLLLANGLHSIPMDFACAKAGIARVPLNPRLAEREQQEILRLAGAELLVSDAETNLDANVIPLAELVERAQRESPHEPDVTIKPDTTALLIATSGTTGKLKLVRHTQASFGAVPANILASLLNPQPGEVMLHAASLIHASGTFVLPYWTRGGTAAVLPGFDPPAYLDAIERFRTTAINLVPTMLNALMQVPGIEDADFSRVGRIAYGASPAPRPVLERAVELWPGRLTQYYGQTEAALALTVLRPEEHVGDRLLSCGLPSADTEVRLDEETGEILVRGPFTAIEYYGAEELTAETFLPDGWVRTRDVGRFDDEGFLYLVDRTSDMIVTGGYNVYPREVEDALAEHAAVREAVVVGAPDERWVEAVTAFVVADGVSEDELIAHCRVRLAGYKTPKSVYFIDEIPKSPVGKLLRRAVRDPLWEGHERPI
jgi:fatty-acyl-CoA synthase